MLLFDRNTRKKNTKKQKQTFAQVNQAQQILNWQKKWFLLLW